MNDNRILPCETVEKDLKTRPIRTFKGLCGENGGKGKQKKSSQMYLDSLTVFHLSKINNHTKRQSYFTEVYLFSKDPYSLSVLQCSKIINYFKRLFYNLTLLQDKVSVI